MCRLCVGGVLGMTRARRSLLTGVAFALPSLILLLLGYATG